MALHPCSFLEYLNGIGEDFDRQVIEELQGDTIHERLMYEFRKYCIVGECQKQLNHTHKPKTYYR